MEERKRVLIIDDERDYVEVLKDRLEFEGFDIDVAYDGDAGLELMARSNFDVVLLDIMMPGMDGFAFVQKLREGGHADTAPIIFVTAYGQRLNEAELCLVDGAPLIRKPFEVDDLLAVMRKVMG